MTNFEELQHAFETLKKFNLPISPILEYSINEKLEEFSSQEETPTFISNPNMQQAKVQTQIHSVEYPSRSNITILRVTRSDGSIIQNNKAASTFCQVIKEIGPQKVMDLNIILDGMNLVQVKIGNGDPYFIEFHDIGNGYYVNTHSNTATKKRQLERIFKACNLIWKVEIV